MQIVITVNNMTVHSIIVIPMSWLKLAFKLRIN